MVSVSRNRIPDTIDPQIAAGGQANVALKENFSKNLCRYLEHTKLTQREFAEEIGVTEASVSRWMNAKEMPPSTRLQKIADYFGATAASFLAPPEKEVQPINPDIETVRDLVKVLNKLLKGSGYEVTRKKR